ncbi:MAG: DUF2249 domain-containing protein [Dysosmobacter sp.]
MDVRHIQGSFFEGLKKRAEALEVGEGLHIIQTFEPHPLYAVMEGLGYEHHTEQRGEAEFHVWFCRVEKKEGDSSAPFKPLALLNYPMIDEKLGQIAVDFWETTWQSEKRVLPYETRLLLSLTNAVGCGSDAAGGAGAGKGIYPRCGERRVGRRVRAAGMESGYRFFQQRDRPLGAVSGVQAH